MTRIAIIGAGFSGLSAACYLAKEGLDVTVFEKNETAGGRARSFKAQGFTFDMGPSWYWMPDVFDRFFQHFGKSSSDYYSLIRLDPSYRIFFGKDDMMDLPANFEKLCNLFETVEPGSSDRLQKFLLSCEKKYDISIRKFVQKPGLSISELLDIDVIKNLSPPDILRSVSSVLRKNFSSPRLLQILEFPILFLGATPQKTPSLYTFMNYADIKLGTWYPLGGIKSVVDGLEHLAKSLGVSIVYNSTVESIAVSENKATGLIQNGVKLNFDSIIASADYQFVEQNLLPQTYRSYSDRYWQSRVMAPSSLLFYIGINKKLRNLRHHSLFFDTDFTLHSKEIYDDPKWPTTPQFYVCCPSQTDSSVAPDGYENLFILIPVASGLNDNEITREKYFETVVDRLEKLTGESIKAHIVLKRSYAHNDFINDYNAFRGNAYGLASTLMQTANFRPSIRSKKVRNLFYTGQLTVPGAGVPPALISGEVVSREVVRSLQLQESRL